MCITARDAAARAQPLVQRRRRQGATLSCRSLSLGFAPMNPPWLGPFTSPHTKKNTHTYPPPKKNNNTTQRSRSPQRPWRRLVRRTCCRATSPRRRARARRRCASASRGASRRHRTRSRARGTPTVKGCRSGTRLPTPPRARSPATRLAASRSTTTTATRPTSS